MFSFNVFIALNLVKLISNLMKNYVLAILFFMLSPLFLLSQKVSIDEDIFCLLGKKFDDPEVVFYCYKVMGLSVSQIYSPFMHIGDLKVTFSLSDDNVISSIKVEDNDYNDKNMKKLLKYIGLKHKKGPSMRSAKFDFSDIGSVLLFKLEEVSINAYYNEMDFFTHLLISKRSVANAVDRNCFPDASAFYTVLPDDTKKLIENAWYSTYGVYSSSYYLTLKQKEIREKQVEDSILQVKRRESFVKDSIANWRRANKDKIPTVWDPYIQESLTLYNMVMILNIVPSKIQMEDLVFKYNFEKKNYQPFYVGFNGKLSFEYYSYIIPVLKVENNNQLKDFGWTINMTKQDFINRYGDDLIEEYTYDTYSLLLEIENGEQEEFNRYVTLEFYFENASKLSSIKVRALKGKYFKVSKDDKLIVHKRCFSGDCLNGTGKYLISSVRFYEGSFENGEYVKGAVKQFNGTYFETVDRDKPKITNFEKKEENEDEEEKPEDKKNTALINIKNGIDQCTGFINAIPNVEIYLAGNYYLKSGKKATINDFLYGDRERAKSYLKNAKNYFDKVDLDYKAYRELSNAIYYTIKDIDKLYGVMDVELKDAAIWGNVHKDKVKTYNTKTEEYVKALREDIKKLSIEAEKAFY
jgi:hypothetical protein